MSELDVLVAQLQELLAGGAEDGEDALELAEIAGLVARLDPTAFVLEEAEVWRDEHGTELLDEGWEDFDAVELFDEIERCVARVPDADLLEEVLSDLDDAVCAAVWCGRPHVVAGVAAQLAELVRRNAAVFTTVAELGQRDSGLESDRAGL